MGNISSGRAFSAGMGLALGLMLPNYMFSALRPVEGAKQVILCQKCGNKNPNENKFCNECGRPLYPPPLARCPRCGSMMAATGNFCGMCGSLLKRQRKKSSK